MDGNLAMANSLENAPEPGDVLEAALPELSCITIADLEKVYIELIRIPCISPKINDFIDFIQRSVQI